VRIRVCGENDVPFYSLQDDGRRFDSGQVRATMAGFRINRKAGMVTAIGRAL
jgi:hypothetical protein